MEEPDDPVEELLRRTKITTKSRYRASERLERHQRLSRWTVALLSVALVFVPMMQALGVHLGTDAIYLSATQAVLAVLVLVYSLLLGQENFNSRAEAMHRNGVELGRFARRLAGVKYEGKGDQYEELAKEYYSILEKYENHKPIDYLFTQLTHKPTSNGEWPTYIFQWIKARVLITAIFSHYLLVMAFVGFILFELFLSIQVHWAH